VGSFHRAAARGSASHEEIRREARLCRRCEDSGTGLAKHDNQVNFRLQIGLPPIGFAAWHLEYRIAQRARLVMKT